MENPTNIIHLQIEEIRESIVDEVPVTKKFIELLDAFETEDKEMIKKKCFEFFNDFKHFAYFRIQFLLVADLLSLFLEEDDIIDFLEILETYFDKPLEAYRTGISELDENGGVELREIRIKRDILNVFERITEYLKDSELHDRYRELLENMKIILKGKEESFRQLLAKLNRSE
ncbi:hypothetical protein GF366_02120 [Candidatus Peregrinibacteria bacterium]|nr:hypothetical protein [Candidatus Peregrinibacteria bacterium]